MACRSVEDRTKGARLRVAGTSFPSAFIWISNALIRRLRLTSNDIRRHMSGQETPSSRSLSSPSTSETESLNLGGFVRSVSMEPC